MKHTIELKNSSGKVLYYKTEENIGEVLICNLSSYASITDVQLTVSFKGISRVLKANINGVPITTSSTSAPTTSGMTVFSTYLATYLFVVD